MTSDDVTWGFWKRSSFCSGGACVEVRRAGRVVNVRDSKEGLGSRIQAWSREEWEKLLRQIADWDPWPEGVEFFRDGSSVVILGLRKHLDDGGLSFAADEWREFEAGVRAGEFDFDRLLSEADQASSGGGGTAGAGGEGPALAGAAAGAGGDRAVSSVPVAAQSGPNVAALNVPAGRVDAGIPVPVPSQVAGRPGLKPPGDGARRAARDAVRDVYANALVVGVSRDELVTAVADAAVDAFLEAVIAEAAAPLVRTDAS